MECHSFILFFELVKISKSSTMYGFSRKGIRGTFEQIVLKDSNGHVRALSKGSVQSDYGFSLP